MTSKKVEDESLPDLARSNPDLVYIFLVTPLLAFIPIPEILRSFLALPFLVIVPVRVGYTFSSIFFRKWMSLIAKFHSATRIFLLWSEGSLITLLLTTILSLIGAFNLNLLIAALLTVVIAPLVLSRLKVLCVPTMDYPNIGHSRRVILLCINAVVVAIAFRAFSTFPLQPAADVLVENIIFNKISYHDFFSILRTAYSSTFFFSGKTPLFPLIAAIACRLTGIDYISLMWVVPFLSIPVFAIGNYFLSFFLTGDRDTSFVAAVVSVWICEATKPTFIHPIQSGMTVVVLPLVLVSIWQTCKESIRISYRVLLVSVIFLFLFSCHYFLGSYLIVALIMMYILYRVSQKWGHIPFFLTLLDFLILFLIFSQKVGFLSLDHIEFDPLSSFLGVESGKVSFVDKYRWIDVWYTLPFFYLSLGGTIYCSRASLSKPRSSDRMNEPEHVLSWGAHFLMLNLGIFFLPISSIQRIFPVIHILIAIFAAYLLTKPLQTSNLSQPKKILAICLMLVSLMPIISQPILNYVHSFRFLYGETHGIATSFSEYELLMGKWIKENTSPEAILVSEPHTQIALEAFADRSSIEGMYLSESRSLVIKMAIVTEDDAVSVYLLRQATETTNEKLVLIITGRVILWATTKATKFYGPIDMKSEDMAFLDKFYNSRHFKFLNQIDNKIFAFEVGIIEP